MLVGRRVRKALSGYEAGREVNGVALHDVLRLYGGQHGVDPAQRALALVFYGRGLEHHVGDKPLFAGLGALLGAGREHCQDDDEYRYSLHDVAKVMKKVIA